MGLNLNSVQLLFEVRADGLSFRRTLTLGRQSFACNPLLFEQLATEFGFSSRDYPWLSNGPLYADGFLKMLGAEEVVALDASSYEGAEIVHDMNLPISEDYHERYDVVLDGGTLEHVFHFPTAVKNCMDMVRCGGCLLFFTPINNYCGHGFYQFSPEMFFRVLNPLNGFEIVRAVAWEERSRPKFYEVSDPAKVKRRVELVTGYPSLMMVCARKREHVARLVLPQQSDYVGQWEASISGSVPADDFQSRGLGLGRFKKQLLAYLFEKHPRLSYPFRWFHRWRQVRRISFRQKLGFTPSERWRRRFVKGPDA